MRSPPAMRPKLPPFCATRSTVLGVFNGNFRHPPSSGPAVELVLNHTSCTVTYTCEYCAGVLPVSDTSVLAEQAASRAHNEGSAMSAADGRYFMPLPVRFGAADDATSGSTSQRADCRQVCAIVPACASGCSSRTATIGRPGTKPVQCAPLDARCPVSAPFSVRHLPLTAS